MWIVPFTISVSARVTVGSTWGSEQFSQHAEQWLLWRSKPSPSQTWSRRWRRESWIRALSTRICDPSMEPCFMASWISSLEASRASRSRERESAVAKMMSVISGLTLPASLTSAFQGWSSSRTWKELSLLDAEENAIPYCTMSSQNWRSEVIHRRGEYSRRLKLALHTIESECSSSPNERAGGNDSLTRTGPPPARRTRSFGESSTNASRLLWPTASARDWKDSPGMSVTRADRKGNARASDQLARAVFHTNGRPRQESGSTSGSRKERLNPDWVETLMGLDVWWTDLGSWGTE